MANINRTDQNRNKVVAGLELTRQASGGFLTSGNVGLVNVSGQLQVKTGAGSYVQLASEAVCVPVDLASTGSGNIIIRQQPGIPGTIAGADFQFVKMPTTSGRACTVQIGIGSGQCSGGVLTLSYKSGGAMTADRVSATAITGQGSFTSGQEITATIATATNGSFAEGLGAITLHFGPPA